MFELKEFSRVQSLDQADDLLHRDKKNVILGGLLWMRMGTRRFHTGIDLSALSLDRIEDKGDCIDIGAMACLRQVETSALLFDNFGPVLRDAVSAIVGVQFRNLATVGGSVFSRFSFSDLITALLILDTRVHLYRGGAVPLGDFLGTSPGRDILVKLSIPKQTVKTSYQSLRKTATDFPVLAAALGRTENGWKIALGARPAKAKLAETAAQYLSAQPDTGQIEAACTAVVEELEFGSNQRGSRSYREHLAKVLVKRGIEEICN
ncbi:MAG: FAD binding domain-containing protein [Desulfobacter sp.]|nr:MAG: FAD binding domain-containing protein [Desulfobacter sp.]